MPPKSTNRCKSGRMKLRRLSAPSRCGSRNITPISTGEAHTESSEWTQERGDNSPQERGDNNRHGVLSNFQVPLVDKTVLPRFSAGANQHFDDVVDLSALPPDMQRQMTSRAPFLLGLKDAVYDKRFYNEVAGLCASGPYPNEVKEKMMPRSKWALKWGGSDDIGDPSPRIWLKDAETDAIQDQYESLYMRVYGNKPDNGSLANFFLRAATYYFEENKPVDWATQALELHEKRFSNPLLNPMKLMPPCLTKQVQGMVNEFAATLANEHVGAFPQAKNLGPSYVDHYKVQVKSAEEDEATCVSQILFLKNSVAMAEQALIAANKALHHHNLDLELLFKAKHDAHASGDTRYVKYSFDQINAIAKTITAGVETVQNLEEELKASKSTVEIAEIEVLPNLRSVLKRTQCTLLDAISEIGVFPQHALPKLPECGAMETLCPYCSRVYVSNAFVPLLCGCRYHLPCMRALIFSGQVNCLACGARPHGTWMAYWGFSLDEEMTLQLEEHRAKSMREKLWVAATPDKVGSKVNPLQAEPPCASSTMAMVPYTTNAIDTSSQSV